jgi:hypothetical protein
MVPSLSRSRMPAACPRTSSRDHRSKANNMDWRRRDGLRRNRSAALCPAGSAGMDDFARGHNS